MYHAMEDNKLYNFDSCTQVEIKLKSKHDEVDIQSFLDDISLWMEGHGDVIKNKYLPFSFLSIGLIPSQASAFLYGCFVGRALENKKLTLESIEKKIDTDEIASRMKRSIKDQMGWLKNLLSQIDGKEGKNE